ncbi:MAG: 2-hydroxyacid dehydrogenase [Anaerolineae bacterium]|jgi:phosphoglycerate dehydrogenase-like enzyme
MPLTVHVLREITPAPLAHLRGKLRQNIALTIGGEVSQSAGYEILVAGRPERQHITASPNLRALIIPYAGLPQETRALMLGFPQIAVHNLHHNAAAGAEMAITLMLAAARFVVPADRALRRHDWMPRYRPDRAVLLAGKTALILGYGAIGQRVARACRGLGMEVIAIRRRRSNNHSPGVHAPEALPSLLPQADALIIALPLTPETEGLIGKEELALLPPYSVLVNVGRGSIVDEEALYRALRDGRLYAAGLDVWYNYPSDKPSRPNTPPSTYPFHELDNVVMSPHRGGMGSSQDIELQRMAHLARLLNAAARGDEMPNHVDLDAGY